MSGNQASSVSHCSTPAFCVAPALSANAFHLSHHAPPQEMPWALDASGSAAAPTRRRRRRTVFGMQIHLDSFPNQQAPLLPPAGAKPQRDSVREEAR